MVRTVTSISCRHALIAACATAAVGIGCGDDGDDPIDSSASDDAGGSETSGATAASGGTEGEDTDGSASDSDTEGAGSEDTGNDTAGPDTDGPTAGHECADRDLELEVIPCSSNLNAEVEPNDIQGQATPYCANETYDGTVLIDNDVDYFEFTVPEAPYGGAIIVGVENVTNGGRMDLEVRTAVDNGVIADNAGSPNESVFLWFEANPGTTYRAIVQEWCCFDGPWDYTLTATWIPVFDCYEPNDTRLEAKSIPLDESVEAMVFAGYVDTDHPDDHEYADWYRIVVEDGPVRAVVSDVPASVRMSVELTDQHGDSVGSDWNGDYGASVTVEETVPAGEYFVHVRPWIEPWAWDEGSELPYHLTTPYLLTVTQP